MAKHPHESRGNTLSRTPILTCIKIFRGGLHVASYLPHLYITYCVCRSVCRSDATRHRDARPPRRRVGSSRCLPSGRCTTCVLVSEIDVTTRGSQRDPCHRSRFLRTDTTLTHLRPLQRRKPLPSTLRRPVLTCLWSDRRDTIEELRLEPLPRQVNSFILSIKFLSRKRR